MGLEKDIQKCKHAKLCEQGMHETLIQLNGKAQCVYCEQTVEADEKYLLMSTIQPPMYRLKAIYTDFRHHRDKNGKAKKNYRR